MALTGSSNEEKIWNYLYSKLNNAYGVAGLMGNIQAESGLVPTNLQNSYEKKLGMTDAQYTAAVDNGSYTNFIKDSAGYGLVQWTYWTLKKDLLNYVTARKKSIGDLETQLEFLCYELSTSFSVVWETCKQATSVLEASNAMLLKFERPADQSVSMQNKRASYGQIFYDKYAKNQTKIGGATMAVKIGHASIDENGRISGGAAGDQTGKEVCTRDWYNKPWTMVLRPKNSTIAEKMATAMEQACANNNIGYDQNQRTTLYTYAKQAGWNLSKIGTKCETDCSALVAVCANAAGLSVSKDMYTGNEEKCLINTGMFTKLTDSKYIAQSAYLKRGDVLLSVGHHTAIVLSNGSSAGASTSSSSSSAGNTSLSGTGIGTAVAKCNMNVRSGSSTSNSVLSTIGKGTAVEVLQVLSNGWYKIVWPGASCGYAYVSNASNSYFTYTAKKVTTTTASTSSKGNTSLSNTGIGTAVAKCSMNIRSGSSTSNSVLSCIGKGTSVEVLEVLSNGWYKIVWPGASCGYAYVSNASNKYFTYTAKSSGNSSFMIKVTISALNIRKGPGTNYGIAGCIRDKGTYTIVQQQSNWGKLKSGAGWICLDYTQRV